MHHACMTEAGIDYANIRIRRETLRRLEEAKMVRRETHDEVINRALDKLLKPQRKAS